VAGRLIEAVSGQTLDVFLEEQLFRPLGMRDTGFRIREETRHRIATVYRPGEEGALLPVRGTQLMAMFEPEARFLWGSGGLLSTPDDFLRFAQMLLNGGELNGVRVLRSETVALMTRNSVAPELLPVATSFVRDPTYGYGLGVATRVHTDGATRPGPAGIFRWSGYLGTYFWVDPENGLLAMVWTQLSPGSRHPLEATFQELAYSALER
jgi:CubicO group peptidase (beta-lactamase class C family)